MNKIAFPFSWSGSSESGMGKDFYDNFSTARSIFEEASQWLSLDMKALCFEKNDKLNLTEYTQAALVTTCLAMEKLWKSMDFFPGCNSRIKPWRVLCNLSSRWHECKRCYHNSAKKRNSYGTGSTSRKGKYGCCSGA